jgi:hypothetical protein
VHAQKPIAYRLIEFSVRPQAAQPIDFHMHLTARNEAKLN